MPRLLAVFMLVGFMAGVAGAEEFVFSSDREGRNEVWLKHLGRPGLLNLTRGRDYEYAPVWSPDGKLIAYRSGLWRGREGHLGLMNADGTSPRRLRAGGYASAVRWSPDGQWLAYSQMADGRKSKITLLKADETAVRSLTGPTAALDAPAWSPDGTRLVFAGEKQGELRVVNADGTGEAVLAQYQETVASPSWSPDGTKLLMVLGTRIAVAQADGANPVPLTNGSGGEAEPVWSPDGRRIAFSASVPGTTDFRNIYTMNADGTDREAAVLGSAVYANPAWSPDGASLAFSIIAAGNWDLFSFNLDNNEVTRLTTTREMEGGAVWSSDGRRMVFNVSTGSPAAWLNIMNADGSNRTKPQDCGHWAAGPQWTPDGGRILFHRYCCPERGG